MNFAIDTATTSSSMDLAAKVREQVFGQHCCRQLPRLDLCHPSQAMTLVARLADTGSPVATVSVMETTTDTELHTAYDLAFPASARVARYCQMAVLKPYRQMHLAAALITEARRRFVVPGQFDYTWLLFPADTAHLSFFCANMRFNGTAHVYSTEYGRCRVLVRNDNAIAYESRFDSVTPLFQKIGNVPHWLPQAVAESEWIAQ